MPYLLEFLVRARVRVPKVGELLRGEGRDAGVGYATPPSVDSVPDGEVTGVMDSCGSEGWSLDGSWAGQGSRSAAKQVEVDFEGMIMRLIDCRSFLTQHTEIVVVAFSLPGAKHIDK
jgi:hypothetical protein